MRDACGEARARLLERHGGTVSVEDARALEQHLLGCPACVAAAENARRGWAMLAHMPETAPPPFLRASTFAAVVEEKNRGQGWVCVGLAAILGLATAALAGLALHVRSGFPPMPPWASLSCGAVWTSLFGAFYYAALSRHGAREFGSFRLSHLSLCALASMGLYLLASALLPVPALLKTGEWPSFLGEPTLLFLAGAAYALVPMLFCVSVLCARSRCGRLAYAVVPSVMFLALLAPGILLECVRFSTGAVAGLALGSALGALVGSGAGMGMGLVLFRPRAGPG